MGTIEVVDGLIGALPLTGRTIVVTRAEAQAAELVEALGVLGADVMRLPTIRIVRPSEAESLERAVRSASDYEGVVFTSVNGVEFFSRAADDIDLGAARALEGSRVHCIGPATARALEQVGVRVDVCPDVHVAEALLESLSDEGPLEGRRFLILVAEEGRPLVPDGLRALGALVDAVVTYRTVPVKGTDPELLERIGNGVDLITFTSPSTVRNFHGLLGRKHPGHAAVIGPVTAWTARDLGYEVVVEARSFTVTGLVDAIVDHFEGGPA
jgi:uroporphyrinogen III methyltransferase/synthase